jgi:hypothetical protein
MRGLSTVLDGVFFLVLVSAAITTLLVTTPTSDPTNGAQADVIANLLATATTGVSYELPPATSDGPTDSPNQTRTAHGTMAELLATAALSNVSVEEHRVTVERRALVPVVRNTTRKTITRFSDHTSLQGVQVRATWSPYPDAPVEGRVVVGEDPPPGVPVHAATLGVASGTDGLDRTGPGSYDAVAGETAAATVSTITRSDRRRSAVLDDGRVRARALARSESLAAALGVPHARPRSPAGVDRVTRRLRRTLAHRYRKQLRQQYASPAAAARNVSTGRVHVVVRTWPSGGTRGF